MKDLSQYYYWLFGLSKKYDKVRKILLGITIILLSSSIYLKGYVLYSFSCIALILQIISWIYKTKIDEINSLAHDLQNIHIISMAYGKVPSRFELSHLKSKIGLWVVAKVDESVDDVKEDGSKFLSDDFEPGNNRLVKMIHENCYWNHYLYKYTYKRNFNLIIIAIIFILIPSALFFPLLKITQNYDFARLIFSFLSFAILYEFLEATLLMKKASESMLEIDNEISRNNMINEENLLNTFSQYVYLKRIVPSPPEKIYDKYKDILNKGWYERTREN